MPFMDDYWTVIRRLFGRMVDGHRAVVSPIGWLRTTLAPQPIDRMKKYAFVCILLCDVIAAQFIFKFALLSVNSQMYTLKRKEGTQQKRMRIGL